MSTSLFVFHDKKFWIHNAVAEVWLSAFVQELILDRSLMQSEKSFVNDITESLDAQWLDGILMSGFETHINDEKKMAAFLPIIQKTNDKLLEQSKSGKTVQVGNSAASTDFLVPEITMLENLFFEREKVPSPPHIFKAGQGWVVA